VKTLALLQFCLLAFFSALLVAEPIEQSQLTAGKLLPGSISPDGRFCLLDVNVGDTTATAVIIATTDRTQNLARTKIVSERTILKPQTNRVAILWAPDSRRVALHDSLPKHSSVAIYRLEHDRFEPLEIQDLLNTACGHWGISRDTVVSSGQRPMRWLRSDLVNIEVSARLMNGQRLRSTFPIHAPSEGKSVRQ